LFPSDWQGVPIAQQMDQRVAFCKLQRTATHCNALQRTATHCSTLRYTATAPFAQQMDPCVAFGAALVHLAFLIETEFNLNSKLLVTARLEQVLSWKKNRVSTDCVSYRGVVHVDQTYHDKIARQYHCQKQ